MKRFKWSDEGKAGSVVLCALDISVYPVAILPIAGGAAGDPVRHGDRHVVAGLHPHRDAHGRAAILGGERGPHLRPLHSSHSYLSPFPFHYISLPALHSSLHLLHFLLAWFSCQCLSGKVHIRIISIQFNFVYIFLVLHFYYT